MMNRKLIVRLVLVALGLVIIGVTAFLLPNPIKRFQKTTAFLFQGAENMARLSAINQKLALRSDLITATRGLYQGLAAEVQVGSVEGKFVPSARALAERLAGRPEVVGAALFKADGTIIPVGSTEVEKAAVGKSLTKIVEEWRGGTVTKVARPLLGGFGRTCDVEIDGRALGMVAYLPVEGETAVGDTGIALILSPEWFLARLPGLFDSVAVYWPNFFLYEDSPEDKETYDFAFGAVQGSDTIYWRGAKPFLKPEDPYSKAILSRTSSGFAPDVDLVVIFGEKQLYKNVQKSGKLLKAFLLIGAIGAGIVIVLVVLGIVVGQRKTKDTWRQIIADDKKFKLGVILLIVLLLGVMAGLNVYLFVKAEKFFYGDLEIANTEDACWMTIALTDNAYEIFQPFARELVAPLPRQLDEARRQEVVAKMAEMPGVQNAFLLDEADKLTSAKEIASGELRDSITAKRSIFKAHFGGVNHPRKFRHWIINQIRFESISTGEDTLRMIIAAYDRDGNHFQVINEKDFRPEMVGRLVALQMDEGWVRKSLAEAMDTLWYDKQIFALWSMADPKKDPIESNGAGILAFGDTLWWTGLKNVETKNKAEGLMLDWQWPGTGWFAFRTVIDASDAMGFAKKPHRIFNAVIAGVDLGFLIIGYLLVMGLFLLRRQWLIQQFALAHLAHAIKTPVARIRINTDSLLKQLVASPEEERDVIQSIDSECSHLERAVRSAAMTLEGIGKRARLAREDLSDIVDEAGSRWQEAYKRLDIGLGVESKEPNVSAMVDKELFATMLDNLLENALRHTSQNREKVIGGKPSVRLSLACVGTDARVSVDDQGGGIGAEDQKRIFQRFSRGAQTAATGVSGLGLGLALAKEIARAHKGSISVEGNSRGGAVFTVSLPQVKQGKH